MRRETIIKIIIGILTTIIIILAGIVCINATIDQLVWQCYLNDFPENLTIHGDFAGEINCTEYYEENYANGKWAERCSYFPFLNSKYGDCHTLCNIDCAYQVKKGGQICVC